MGFNAPGAFLVLVCLLWYMIGSFCVFFLLWLVREITLILALKNWSRQLKHGVTQLTYFVVSFLTSTSNNTSTNTKEH